MVILKSGVTVRGVCPEIAVAITVVSSIYAQHGYDCVLTSVTDGVHGRTSRHYSGAAVDFRIRHVPKADIRQILRVVQDALGPDDFDIVLEQTHLHVEFDPKRID